MEDSKQLKVAVIEDEDLLRDAIVRKLKMHDITVYEFTDGKKAIDGLNQQSALPDVIWLDYYLPDMDGLGFMKALTQNEKLANIPVVVISNSANPGKVKAMLDLGVKEYLLKAEYKLDSLIDIIKQVANHKPDETPAPLK